MNSNYLIFSELIDQRIFVRMAACEGMGKLSCEEQIAVSMNLPDWVNVVLDLLPDRIGLIGYRITERSKRIQLINPILCPIY